jgi:threonine dehydrogenase-like Zn-dependent dehydrogenase
MIEPAATPYHALTARAPVAAGDAVAILGVGGLGILGVQVAKILGAAQVIAVDVNERALDRALAVGATHAVHASEQDVVATVRELSGGVHVALECVGREETCRWAVEMLRPAGIAALVGIGPVGPRLPATTVFARTEIEVRGVYAYSRPELERVAALISDGKLDARAAIGAVYPLEHVNEAVEQFRRKDASSCRVLVAP